VSEQLPELRARLEAVLAPGVVDAIEELVSDRVRAALEAHSPNVDASPWFSLEEGADYLRVSPRTLERQLARGGICSTTIGRRRLLRRDDLDELAKAATREDVTPATSPRRRAQTLDPDHQEV
jgi:excisionase family DNA binding protein